MLFRKTRFIFLLVLFFLPGCVLSEDQERLAQYINDEILHISPVEEVAFKRYAAVTGENYTSMDSLADALKHEVIPTYERFYDLVKAIKPNDPEISKAHAFYVRGARDILDGFKMKLHGVAEKDVYVINTGNDQIAQGMQQTLTWKSEIEVLLADRDLATSSQERSKFIRWLEDFADKMSRARI
jgi:hypothetical protein